MRAAGNRKAAGRRATVAVSATADAERVLDLCDRAAGGVEELCVHGGPAAEVLDGEQLCRRRELRRVDVRLHDRAVAVVGEDLLRGVRVQVVDERLGQRG